jgi:hypothetical protein
MRGIDSSLTIHEGRTSELEMEMSIERIVFAFAGVMILLSVVLAYFVNPYWLALAVVIGLNLSQAAFTAFCPLAYVLKKLGLKSGTAFT